MKMFSTFFLYHSLWLLILYGNRTLPTIVRLSYVIIVLGMNFFFFGPAKDFITPFGDCVWLRNRHTHPLVKRIIIVDFINSYYNRRVLNVHRMQHMVV